MEVVNSSAANYKAVEKRKRLCFTPYASHHIDQTPNARITLLRITSFDKK